MTAKLRKKFIATAMLSLLIIIVLLLLILNLFNFMQITKRADNELMRLYNNNGKAAQAGPYGLPEGPDGDDQASGTARTGMFPGRKAFMTLGSPDRGLPDPRYFTVCVDRDGNSVFTFINTAISEESALEYAGDVLSQTGGAEAVTGPEKGYYGTWRYLAAPSLEGTDILLIFTDCSDGFYNALSLLKTSLLMGCLTMGAMFLLVFLFSGKAVRPYVEAMEKQKRFISDAGHELKTPLAVISADTDVLELTGTENKWTKSIRDQITRMTSLISQLLLLARLDDPEKALNITDVSLSELLIGCIRDMDPRVAALQLTITEKITPGVQVRGDRELLRQLCNILLDNALKYTDDGGSVVIELKKGKNVRLAITNSCKDLSEEDPERFFERFYRSDPSRSRNSGGSGIGLSSAKAICEAHHGTISAVRIPPESVCFYVILPG